MGHGSEAHSSGAATQAGRVAMESVDRIRLSRAPRMKYKRLLSNGAQLMGRAAEYFRRVAKQTGSPQVRVLANEREYICEAMRTLFAPYAPSGEGLAPPTIRPEG